MSQEFYGGNVADGPKVRVEREDVTFPWPDRAHPFFFRHVRDASRPEQHGGRRGTSTYNQLEADAVVECVVALLDGGVLAREIGVIAMYDAQKTLLSYSAVGAWRSSGQRRCFPRRRTSLYGCVANTFE